MSGWWEAGDGGGGDGGDTVPARVGNAFRAFGVRFVPIWLAVRLTN